MHINPHPPEILMTPGNGISRLFPDAAQTSKQYIQRHGYFPIMHVLALEASLLDRHPSLADDLCRLFAKAKAIAR